jgi:hypothetical protein
MTGRTALGCFAAVGTAAAVAGIVAVTYAQAPPSAKLAAPWPDAAAMRERRLEAEALPLFASVEPFDIAITADFKAVQRDRDTESTTLFPGSLAVLTDGVAGKPIPIQLRTRGHVRRNNRTCSFAPLRLEFPKDEVKGTIFQGQRVLKLGTYCQDTDVYEQYTLGEHLTYRVSNVLTPRSFRSRLARVTYVDSAAGKKPVTRAGIFIENEDDVAKRMEGREVPMPRLLFKDLDQPTLTQMSLFQYMIGNTDYSIIALHNVRLVVDAKKVFYPVPYDFDYSGLVDAHYAVPSKALGQPSVRDRLYRGPCRTEAELESALEPFRARKAEILALPDAIPGFDERHRREAGKYLAEFFEFIDKPGRARRTFVTDCKAQVGM